jgi:hypothetical protein
MFPLQHKWKKTKGGNFKKVYGYYVHVKDYGKIWKEADVEERILFFRDVIWGKPVPEDHFINAEERRRVLYMTLGRVAQGFIKLNKNNTNEEGKFCVKKLNKRIDEHNKRALEYGKRKED